MTNFSVHTIKLPLNLLLISIFSSCSDGVKSTTDSSTQVEVEIKKPIPEPVALENMPPLYQPDENKVLVFVGQDNQTVGGNGRHNDGYVDIAELGTPAGITTYLGLSYDCASGLPGVNSETSWGAGPINMSEYVLSHQFDQAIIHLSLDMASNNSEFDVAAGHKDACIDEIANFIRTHNDHFFLVRIGYEFDGQHNTYDAKAFKQAFRRIVDKFTELELTNFNTVMTSITMDSTNQSWQDYWPGDEYVHWVGYSYFGGKVTSSATTLTFSRAKNKPVFIAETAPRGAMLDQLTEIESEALWNSYFSRLFKHIEQNGDVIKALSYINTDWDSQPLWAGQGWGNSRLQSNITIKNKWISKMTEARYIHSPSLANTTLGYAP
ncbi:glycosyl hydrolase [Paraglaciecola sp. L3A3]|uniref:glycosyl hydrolase n=1 Tax=Paraglaciecola sp. L3A3 TaxID=2686358 RepID=UPI00131EB3C2|nr:glycosyl hydrolase [Paraglaciecola sp. L3A3]